MGEAALKLVPPLEEEETLEKVPVGRGHVDPHTVRPLHAWILVREDDNPTVTAGGIIIPETSRYQGRRNTKGDVIAVGNGISKPSREGGPSTRWEMPKPGERIAFPILAHLPDTQKRFQGLFKLEDDSGGRYFFLHAMDVLFAWDPKDGEPEVE